MIMRSLKQDSSQWSVFSGHILTLLYLKENTLKVKIEHKYLGLLSRKIPHDRFVTYNIKSRGVLPTVLCHCV
jgi:hypothetical protein